MNSEGMRMCTEAAAEEEAPEEVEAEVMPKSIERVLFVFSCCYTYIHS